MLSRMCVSISKGNESDLCTSKVTQVRADVRSPIGTKLQGVSAMNATTEEQVLPGLRPPAPDSCDSKCVQASPPKTTKRTHRLCFSQQQRAKERQTPGEHRCSVKFSTLVQCSLRAANNRKNIGHTFAMCCGQELAVMDLKQPVCYFQQPVLMMYRSLMAVS